MKQRFIKHLDSIQHLDLFNACEEILAIPEFFTWPASLGFHHTYDGGLLAHTVEVCDIAAQASGYHENRVELDFNVAVHYDILTAACLWHDVMKIREYERSEEANKYGGFWKHTENYANRIHHIPGSAIEFTVAARKHGVTHDVIEAVQHCILAHHGRREWGSPVEPQTLEALLLHQADMLSAKFGRTKEVMS